MAVYTHIDESALTGFLSGFDIGSLVSFEGIAEGVENSNYRLTTDRGRYILTLIEKRVSVDELPFYSAFMEHLRENGVPCPETIPNRDGQKVSTLADKPALVTTFLEGAWPRDITVSHCAAIGEMLGRMHMAGRGFAMKRKNSLSLQAWNSLIRACADRADTLEKGLNWHLGAELDYLEKRTPKFLPKGAVHADLFPDNVFFKDGKISGIIDFYFACSDTFAYDLMLTLNPWCFDKAGSLDKEKSAALLSSYHKVRPLSKNELKALPFFGRAAAMRIIATRLYDWLNPSPDALVKPKDPLEHVKILRFHQGIESAAGYGFVP